jgi:hypothetical protein
MRTFDFIQSAISHNLKDPHSKALEPDCLSPPLAIMTQSLKGGKLFVDNFLVKKPLGYTVFVKDLSMAKMNMPMDDQV